MLGGAPRLFHLVFVAACLVGAAVLLIMWQMDKMHDRAMRGMYLEIYLILYLVNDIFKGHFIKVSSSP